MTQSLEAERVERLRKKLYDKAKLEPSYRFYTLYDKVCWRETLERAYTAARGHRGAPGVDGVRFEDIEAQGVEPWLGELREELAGERYLPQAVRRVMMPKPGGGKRPLGIPTVRDRVVQTALALILEPIFEADFEENAYGYRRGRSAHDALEKVQEGIGRGKVHVVDADLTSYFDTIPHRDLLRSVARRGADGKVLRLIKLWLKAPVEARDDRGGRRISGGKKSKRGIPQGGVVSPLLANIYMNRFLRHWREQRARERIGEVVNYADDLVILCRHQERAEQGLSLLQRWMGKLGLEVNGEKTRVCDVRQEEFDFLGYTFGQRRCGREHYVRIGANPSKKAQKRLKEKINALLYRGNPAPWSYLRDKLNRLLVGWANYFSFGGVRAAYQAIWWHVARRVRLFLCKRHKLRARGARRFGWREVYGASGVEDLCRRIPRRGERPAHALS